MELVATKGEPHATDKKKLGAITVTYRSSRRINSLREKNSNNSEKIEIKFNFSLETRKKFNEIVMFVVQLFETSCV